MSSWSTGDVAPPAPLAVGPRKRRNADGVAVIEHDSDTDDGPAPKRPMTELDRLAAALRAEVDDLIESQSSTKPPSDADEPAAPADDSDDGSDAPTMAERAPPPRRRRPVTDRVAFDRMDEDMAHAFIRFLPAVDNNTWLVRCALALINPFWKGVIERALPQMLVDSGVMQTDGAVWDLNSRLTPLLRLALSMPIEPRAGPPFALGLPITDAVHILLHPRRSFTVMANLTRVPFDANPANPRVFSWDQVGWAHGTPIQPSPPFPNAAARERVQMLLRLHAAIAPFSRGKIGYWDVRGIDGVRRFLLAHADEFLEQYRRSTVAVPALYDWQAMTEDVPTALCALVSLAALEKPAYWSFDRAGLRRVQTAVVAALLGEADAVIAICHRGRPGWAPLEPEAAARFDAVWPDRRVLLECLRPQPLIYANDSGANTIAEFFAERRADIERGVQALTRDHEAAAKTWERSRLTTGLSADQERRLVMSAQGARLRTAFHALVVADPSFTSGAWQLIRAQVEALL